VLKGGVVADGYAGDGNENARGRRRGREGKGERE